MTPRPSLYAECLTCEERIHADELCVREPGIGCWHPDCGPPRNLRLYRRDRDLGKPQRVISPYIESTDSVRA